MANAAQPQALRRRPTALALLILHAAGTAAATTIVGRVAGEFMTSPTGAATYTIPIEVAAGIGGLRPEIALTYNSQGGDGPAGIGWTLAGFSRITRCPLTLALDGRVQGVRFTAEDRFCLDGRPLVLVSGTHGGSGAEYRTEVHAYERVFAWGRQGSGPAWFELRRPDGAVQRFGNDADSRVEAAGSTEVVAWALNEVEDRFQQRIGFTYVEDNARGEHYPSEVRWTYGAGESPEQARLRLALHWENREPGDVREGFLWGKAWRSSVRLAAIDYEADSGAGLQRVHRYGLAYQAYTPGTTPRGRLSGVTQCGPADCLPPTTFQWNEHPGERTLLDAIGPEPQGAIMGDYNGDGALDLFGIQNGSWAVWPADPQSGGFGGPVFIGTGGNYKVGLPIDFDGDGLTDLLVSGGDGFSGLLYRSPSAAGGTFTAQYFANLSPAAMEIQAIDVDGDTLDDLVYLRNGTAYLRRNLGGSLAAEQSAGLRGVSSPYSPMAGGNGFVEPADFDGDGRTDLLVARSTKTSTGEYRWEAFLSTGTRFATDPIASFTTQAAPRRALVADLNGDGLSDVLRHADGAWQSYLSRGTGSSSSPGLVAQSCPGPLPANPGKHAAVLDYDGDGRSDLLLDEGIAWRVYTPVAGCLSAQRFIALDEPTSTGLGTVLPADTNGDGSADIVFGTNPYGQWLTSVHQGAPDGHAGLLGRITDGLGHTTIIGHRPLTGSASYHATGTAPAHTRLLRGGPLNLVVNYARSTGLGNETAYVVLEYTDALVDLRGRGLLGFARITASDQRTGLRTETAYRQLFPYTGQVEQVTVRDGVYPVSSSDPSWSAAATPARDAAGDVHFVYLSAETSENHEVDPDGGQRGNVVRHTVRTLGWNLVHGAVTNEESVVSSPQEGNIAYRTTRSVTLDDALRTGSGCLGQPLRIDVTRDIAGGLAETRTTQYAWQPGTCRLVARTEGPPAAPARQLRTTYAYDGVGRTSAVTLQDGAGQLPARQTRYDYQPGSPHPVTEAAVVPGEPELAVGHQWDQGLGLALRRVTPQGLATSWTYDDFGRLRAETRSPGSTQLAYAACGPCLAPNARYSVREVRSDGQWSESQHDNLGRVVGRSRALPHGRVSHQLLEYDASGRLARESTPFLDGAASIYWTTYRYDRLGRIKAVERPVSEAVASAPAERFIYAGLDTWQMDAESRMTGQTSDAEGRLVAMRGGVQDTTTYAYGAHGQLLAVTDPGGHRREFGYDEAGRLIETRDPDAGRRRFDVNAFGEVVGRTDGDATTPTATWQYDVLGRLVRRTEPEGTTSWTYSAAPGPARGLLASVSTSGAMAYQESSTYDDYSRLQQVTRTIDGVAYRTDYDYDSENKLRAITYPSTVGWRPQFLFGYSAGELTVIAQQTLAITPVYWLYATDAAGRETLAGLGEGDLLQETVYDAAGGQLTAIRAGSFAAPGELQDHAYEWDRVGNLLAREDRGTVPRHRETFSYDAADRLTRATLDGAPTLSVSYGADGNVVSRSDVGAYAYSATRPHAVTAVTGGPPGTLGFTYDAQGRMTSRHGTPVSWTSFGQPQQIGTGTSYSRFGYGPGHSRVRQEIHAGRTSRVIHYVGPHFEVEIEGGTRRYRSTVYAGGRAVFSQVESSAGGLEAYYLFHDHQGSVTGLARAAGTGNDTAALAFDAWGQRRNPDWSADPAGARYADSHWTERGYTGHEHLDPARLIHMNGRVQDPLLGRMLSPDPVIGSLGAPQTLNPYSYVANNPVSYVDPSGFFLSKLRKTLKRAVRHVGSFGRRVVRNWGRPIAAAIAAYYTAGAVSSWYYAAQAPGLAAGELAAAQSTSMVLGGMAGGAVAGAISTGELRGVLVGAAGGAAMAGIGAQWGGGYSIGRVAAEATVGGISAELNGGEFRQGFLVSGGLSATTWAALEMREAMVAESKLDPRNAGGVSAGFRGDGFKLGGSRWPARASMLGGAQGGEGSFFGIDYKAGSFLDHLIETYAGPHDFLNSPIFYDQLGNNAGRWAGLEIFNAANVIVATPFAAASVVPSFAYPALVD